MVELWDLLDEHRQPLAIKHRRGKSLPKNVYHQTVFIWTVSTDGLFLITKRSLQKPWGGYWENTGGSVLAGEDRELGAIRELYEETGIKVEKKDLIIIKEEKGRTAFEDTFLIIVDKKNHKIVLQKSETIDYKWITYQELNDMIKTKQFAEPVIRRFMRYQDDLISVLKDRGVFSG